MGRATGMFSVLLSGVLGAGSTSRTPTYHGISFSYPIYVSNGITPVCFVSLGVVQCDCGPRIKSCASLVEIHMTESKLKAQWS